MAAVTVNVPATTANLGPGFDTLGLALTRQMRVHLCLAEPGVVEVENVGEGAADLPTDGHNLIYRAVAAVYARCGRPLPGVRIHQESEIPVTSGLGSSSAAIIAGLVGGNALAGAPLSQDELLTLAIALEGHPDNVAPALFGGFVSCAVSEAGHLCRRLPVSPALRAVIVTPDFRLLTREARAVLPARIAHRDAVFNLGRLPLLLHALASADYALLRTALEDRLHQPYRIPLIPGFAAALEAAQRVGAAAALSGSGPTLIAFAPDGHAQIAAAAGGAFAAAGVAWRSWSVGVDMHGARLQDVSP